MPVSPEAMFRWHMRDGAFERLTPPWQDVRVLERSGRPDREGFRVTLSLGLGPLRRRWVAEHRHLEPARGFRDVAIDGPFRSWEHAHRFLPNGGAGSVLEDDVRFELPLGPLGRVGERALRASLERLFQYRHAVTAGDLAAHARYDAHIRDEEGSEMKILVTGSSGLVGRVLLPFLKTGGHEVVPLLREESASGNGAPRWSPQRKLVPLGSLEGFDGVVHLAGESIASGRWTEARKKRIRESREQGTRLLSESLARLERKPKVLVSASAVGFYGDRGAELLDERSERGDGFLADVCERWEQATEPARAAGIRVVHLRVGVVLSGGGGALRKMLPPFELGLGGVIGSGDQYMSWISVDDLATAILHALVREDLEGPVNAVAPTPVTNRELARALGRVLRRPTILPLPALAARLALGEMAGELLLASARVEPSRLLESGFVFRHGDVEQALRHVLGRPERA